MFFWELTPSDANLLQASKLEDVPFINNNYWFYLETWYKIFKVIISISELIKITLLHVLFCINFPYRFTWMHYNDSLYKNLSNVPPSWFQFSLAYYVGSGTGISETNLRKRKTLIGCFTTDACCNTVSSIDPNCRSLTCIAKNNELPLKREIHWSKSKPSSL